MIPRDLHIGNEKFEAIQIGDKIRVEIKKSRFQVNDTHILSIAEYIQTLNNFVKRNGISENNLSVNKKVFNHPKGYLFIGPPGTGKTLLAQAVAGEAQVNLICLSASEIQKQIDIGTRIGAIRLRNLFEQAKKSTPCILFLDEIDAIGRARNESMDLKLFTEFLIQMDNFSPKDGFLVIGTTNFLSSLDSAFVRSGRFDRIIGLNYPGKQTRIAILKLYAQKGKNGFDKTIPWDSFGERTKGLSAADLAKVVNESSLYLIQSNFLNKPVSGFQEKALVTAEIAKLGQSREKQGEENTQESSVRISYKKTLMHTTKSLERGLLRISAASKNSKFIDS
jgi:ATP-dependent Zn protease